MRQIAFSILVLLFILAPTPAKEPAEPFVLVGKAVHPPIAEMSGMVKSATYDDVYWVLNDSGDSARLFAIDGKGGGIMPPWQRDKFFVDKAADGKKVWPGVEILAASNVDWEDLALADGMLFVADTGNNGNARRDLGVYVVNEPSPGATQKTRALKFLPVRYPDQTVFPAKNWHFDCEAVFVADGKLHFLTRHRMPGKINQGAIGTKLYRLDTEHTERENVLTLVEKRFDMALPGSAEMSPDRERLAVLTVMSLWVFERPEEEGKWLSGKARRLLLPRKETKQAEAVCWDDDDTIRIANEEREIYTVELDAIPDVK